MTEDLKQLKGSEILKIEAAVLEVMEHVGFDPEFSQMMLQEAENGKWMMVFYKKDTSLADLLAARNRLGEHFDMFLEARDKYSMKIIVVAEADSFITLLGVQDENDEEPPLDFDPDS